MQAQAESLRRKPKNLSSKQLQNSTLKKQQQNQEQHGKQQQRWHTQEPGPQQQSYSHEEEQLVLELNRSFLEIQFQN
jgi:hypothetical protein